MNHNNNFHFIRLIGALLIIITHAYLVVGNFEIEPIYILSGGTISIASIGLYMFFFTSGFLVTHSARESENTVHFLFKRFLRIYPALIVVVLISVFIAGPLLTRLSTGAYYQHPDTWRYLGNVLGIGTKLYLPGVFDGPKFHMGSFNVSLWSISLELKLYLSLAVLLALGLIRKRKVHLLICTFILLTAYLYLLLDHYDFIHIRPALIRDIKMVMAFFLGSLIQTGKPSTKLLGISGILAGLAFILRCAGVIELMPLMDDVILFCTLTWFIAFLKKFTIHLTNDISYGVFLCSMPIQQICYIFSGYNTSQWLNILLSLGPIIGFGWLSWKCIEKPSLQLKPYYHKFSAALNPWH